MYVAEWPGTVERMNRTPTLVLVTKASCHLCQDARDVVSAVAAELGLSWNEISLDGDAELTARYGEEIPVVLVDGVQRDFWHIDPVRLRSILSSAMAAGSQSASNETVLGVAQPRPTVG